jgi:hypothetical protein
MSGPELTANRFGGGRPIGGADLDLAPARGLAAGLATLVRLTCLDGDLIGHGDIQQRIVAGRLADVRFLLQTPDQIVVGFRRQLLSMPSRALVRM